MADSAVGPMAELTGVLSGGSASFAQVRHVPTRL